MTERGLAVYAVVAVAAATIGAAATTNAGMLGAQTQLRLRSEPRVGARVVDALDGQPSTRVLIVFTAGEPHAARFDSPRARAVLHTAREALLQHVGKNEFVERRRFESINAIAGEITAAGLLQVLDNPGVVRVDLDEGGSGHTTPALALTNVDAVQNDGLIGTGITVAVIDSGIDTTHVDLADSLVAEQCFCTNCCPDGSSQQSGPGSAEDDNGHGTNVSGIITSNGLIAPLGAAPAANIVAVKVLDHNNNFCCTSDVVAALDWIIDNRPDVDAVNMSLGTAALYPGACDNADAFTMSFATAIDTLTARGVSVFASSGNQHSATTMAAPACVANTFAIGAVWASSAGTISLFGCTDVSPQADQVTCFTNSDSSLDVLAPGAPITSTGIGGGTSTYFGTSQASPLVAACSADLLQRSPGLTPPQLELALKSSPTVLTDPKNGLSFPRLDCLDALGHLHDSVVKARPALNVTIPKGATSVQRKVRVTVTNADRVPTPETPGHTIQLTASTTGCPASVLTAQPDFIPKTAAIDGTVQLVGGKSATAVTLLTFARDDLTSFNRKAPFRCQLTFTASSVGAIDPTPSNNAFTMDLNVIDLNDPDQTAQYESVIASPKPITVGISKNGGVRTKTVRVQVTNADFLPMPEPGGHDISVIAADGDCPPGIAGAVDFDAHAAGAQTSANVNGGASKAGKLALTIDPALFKTSSAISPARCTLTLTANGPVGNIEPEPSNNTTHVVIDVNDKTDY
jgi:subtilisin family serine protease